MKETIHAVSRYKDHTILVSDVVPKLVTYVRISSNEELPGTHEEFKKAHEILEKDFGFMNLNFLGKNSELFRLQMKYCVVNHTDKSFADSSDNYGNPSVAFDEFIHSKRGKTLGRRFGV
jgi:hypothetical protein